MRKKPRSSLGRNCSAAERSAGMRWWASSTMIQWGLAVRRPELHELGEPLLEELRAILEGDRQRCRAPGFRRDARARGRPPREPGDAGRRPGPPRAPAWCNRPPDRGRRTGSRPPTGFPGRRWRWWSCRLPRSRPASLRGHTGSSRKTVPSSPLPMGIPLRGRGRLPRSSASSRSMSSAAPSPAPPRVTSAARSLSPGRASETATPHSQKSSRALSFSASPRATVLRGRQGEVFQGFRQAAGLVDARRQHHDRALVEDHLVLQPQLVDGLQHRFLVRLMGGHDHAPAGEFGRALAPERRVELGRRRLAQQPLLLGVGAEDMRPVLGHDAVEQGVFGEDLAQVLQLSAGDQHELPARGLEPLTSAVQHMDRHPPCEGEGAVIISGQGVDSASTSEKPFTAGGSKIRDRRGGWPALTGKFPAGNCKRSASSTRARTGSRCPSPRRGRGAGA